MDGHHWIPAIMSDSLPNQCAVLILGSGGREHALFRALSLSPKVTELWVAPGNGGIPEKNRATLAPMDFAGVLAFCRQNRVGLVVVGPEDPLVAGITDFLSAAGIPCFGPDRFAAQLEGSKEFAKNIMRTAAVSTATYQTFADFPTARDYLQDQAYPLVLKFDGLAAGKGVLVAQNPQEALDFADEVLRSGRFPQSNGASPRLVVEEYLTGQECSLFALCDGEIALPLVPAQDHKQVGEGDTGANTGGMGAYAPTPVLNEEMRVRAINEIFQPVLAAMRAMGHPFRGLLYAGLMIDGTRMQVLEFNCRFGDPETQVVLPLVENDWFELLYRAATGSLAGQIIRVKPGYAVTVVLAAKGYPGEYAKGFSLSLTTMDQPTVYLIHAGTRIENNRLIATGGRVLNATAFGPSLPTALTKAYEIANLVLAEHTQLFARKDIGHRVLRPQA